MLAYLMSSKTKEKLLKLLWLEKAVGTVSDLSRLAEVSYATTYDELKKMEGAGLALSERVGNSLCYRANEKASQADALRALLGEPKSRRPASDEDVVWNLSRLGAPVAVSFERGSKDMETLSPEETFAEAMKLAHRNPTVARVLPVALALHGGRLNQERLSFLAKRSKEHMTLGFFLELTGELSGQKELTRWARRLRDRRVSKPQEFFTGPKSKYERELARLNTPKLAAKWHFTMNMGMDSFSSLFEKNVR